MDWTTLITLGLFGWDKLEKRREDAALVAAESALPPPLVFSDQQVASFTSPRGPHRTFDPDVTIDILNQLSSRSAVELPDANLLQHGRAWIVTPLQEGQRLAIDVVLEAWADPSVAVLGSHSLVLLGNGSPAPMVLLVGPPAARLLAIGAAPDRRGGVFAMIERPQLAAAAEVEAPPPVPAAPDSAVPAAPEPAPEPFPPPLANGVHKEADAPPFAAPEHLSAEE